MHKVYLDSLADLFYPQRCACCGRRASDVMCRNCAEELPLIGRPLCKRCGAPTAFEVFVCGQCNDLDFGFERARAPLRYEGVGASLVHALKYRGYMRVVERVMVPLLAEVVEGRFDQVVPVPLHRSRMRKRGFNQAMLIAQGLGRKIKTRVSDRIEVVRRTRDQVELSGSGRRANVRGAFEPKGSIAGRVLLVDDVFTTGATLSECATVLNRAGAREVHAVSLCRTC